MFMAVKMICPLLTICKSKISLEQYSNVCANMTKDAYKECPEYKKLSAEQKTPLDWSKILTVTPT
jgi:hypothetical protein